MAASRCARFFSSAAGLACLAANACTAFLYPMPSGTNAAALNRIPAVLESEAYLSVGLDPSMLTREAIVYYFIPTLEDKAKSSRSRANAARAMALAAGNADRPIDERAIAVLSGILQSDAAAQVRSQAALALVPFVKREESYEVFAPAIKPAERLLAAVMEDRDAEVSRAAIDALDALDYFARNFSEMVAENMPSLIERMARGGTSEERHVAAWDLVEARARGAKVTGAYLEALGSGDVELRRLAAEGLGWAVYGDHSRELKIVAILDAILEKGEDEDGGVREKAQKSRERLALSYDVWTQTEAARTRPTGGVLEGMRVGIEADRRRRNEWYGAIRRSISGRPRPGDFQILQRGPP